MKITSNCYILAGFAHAENLSSNDLKVVRLCFQVFLPGPNGKCSFPLKPVVSNPIRNKLTSPDLVINKLSHCNAPCSGGQEMIILCGKVC